MPALILYNAGMATVPDPSVVLDNVEVILSGITDARTRQGFGLLLNLVERLTAENHSLREDNQRFRDEIARLKGEKGKPQFKPGKPGIVVDKPDNHSSEKERRKPKEWHKGVKLDRISIDRHEYLSLDPATLPEDAVRKGYEEVVVQELRLCTDNVRFFKEKWYSPSTRQTFIAPLPQGYDGEYGPELKAVALSLHFVANVSQAKLLEFLHNAGILISAGEVSGILTGSCRSSREGSFHRAFHQEYEAIFRAGLKSSDWQGTDHTPTTVNGEQQQCQVVGNSLYSIYATTPGKDRLSVLDVLQGRVHPTDPSLDDKSSGRQSAGRQSADRTYLLNDQAHRYLEAFPFSKVIRRTLRELPQEEFLKESVFLSLLSEHLPQLSTQQFNQVLDAGAIATYHAQEEWPVIPLLLCDDAPVFRGITSMLALCWVHDGRHYKKLTPFVPLHRQLLEGFRKQYWSYYDELLAYKEHPTPQEAERLSLKFETIFQEVTGYEDLDQRIARTLSKKVSLLRVLQHPELPLHNNDCELAARVRVRKRDVSFGPRSQEGVRAWDIFLSLSVTARKLGVSFHRYLYDRISRTYAMVSLAELISQRSCPRARQPLLLAA